MPESFEGLTDEQIEQLARALDLMLNGFYNKGRDRKRGFLLTVIEGADGSKFDGAKTISSLEKESYNNLVLSMANTIIRNKQT